MRTITYDLRSLLAEASRQAFKIPRFQRDFVWNTGQVKLLIDSISRNYPIGSLLLLAEGGTNTPVLNARPIQAAIREDTSTDEQPDDLPRSGTEPAGTTFYVLDGQQRLTSIVRVFLQAEEDKIYYFDLNRLRQIGSGEQDDETAWVIKRGRRDKLPRQYLRADTALEPERSQLHVAEYFETDAEDLEGDRDAQRKATARVNKVLETIRNYQIPLVVIDREEPLEAICRIFETINSTGTRLTTFDLAVARFFPLPDLSALWHASLARHDILRRYDVSGERVLQVISLIRSGETGSYPEVSRGVLLQLPGDFIEQNWATASAHLADAYKWAEDHGATPKTIPNEVLIVAMAGFFHFAKNQWKQRTPRFNSFLERWYFANAFQAGARATNYNIGQRFTDLKVWCDTEQLPSCPSVELSEQQILRLRKSDNRYRALHCLLRAKARQDLRTGDILRAENLEDHHIFPKSMGKRMGLNLKQLDSIANKILVSCETNRHLSDRSPHEYMEELRKSALDNGTIRRFAELLKCAALPSNPEDREFVRQFSVECFDSFLKERVMALMELILEQLPDDFRQGSSADGDCE